MFFEEVVVKGLFIGDDVVVVCGFFLAHVFLVLSAGLQYRAVIKYKGSIVPQIRKSKKLPFSSAQMFDLVADVERYPEFLPWCSEAKLVKRDDKEIVGTLTAVKGGLRKSFTTRNRYEYPKWMDITLVEGPFKKLNGRWDFVEQDDGGCVVNYRMDFEVPFLLAPILGGFLDYMANTMVDSFAQRARAVYGDPAR